MFWYGDWKVQKLNKITELSLFNFIYSASMTYRFMQDRNKRYSCHKVAYKIRLVANKVLSLRWCYQMVHDGTDGSNTVQCRFKMANTAISISMVGTDSSNLRLYHFNSSCRLIRFASRVVESKKFLYKYQHKSQLLAPDRLAVHTVLWPQTRIHHDYSPWSTILSMCWGCAESISFTGHPLKICLV